MVIFGTDKNIPGCFAKMNYSSGAKGAVFKMDGFNDQNCIVTNFQFTQKDDFVPVKCIGDISYLDVFGKAAVSEMEVTFTLFLIKGKEYTGSLHTLKDKFKQRRLSNKQHMKSRLTVGSRTLVTGYATEMTFSSTSTQLGIAAANCKLVSLKDR